MSSSTCKLFLCIPPRPQKQRVLLRKSTLEVAPENQNVNEEGNIKPRRSAKNRVRPTSVVRHVQAPNPHSTLAVFTCLFCFPFGLVAFTASTVAKSRINKGDNVRAKAAAEVAYFCSAMSIFFGIVSILSFIIIIIALSNSK